MKRSLLVLAIAGGSVSVANAQSLATLPPNNGSGGVFMDLTPGSALNVTSFDTYFSSVAGSLVTVEVWTRPGSYVGFDASNVGWTLHETATGTSSGTTALGPLPLTTPILLPGGTTTAVYLHATTTGGGIRYQGTGTTSTSTFSNSELTLFSDVARTGTIPFGGSRFTPRAFAGVVHYQVANPNAVGACCFSDGTCQFITVANCSSLGGSFAGENITCATANCPQPGACCMPDGTCSVIQQSACVGGVFNAGMTCAQANCPQPGACCFTLGGGCVNLMEADCVSMGGTFQGSGSFCGQGQCWTAPILYHNGPIITGLDQGFNGADVSQLPTGANTIGENVNFAAGVRIADEFRVPAGETWTVTRLRSFAYQTGSFGFTMTALYARIWDGDPADPSSQVVWGDLGTFVTNVMDPAASGLEDAYRVTTNLQDTARQIQRVEAAVPNVQLGAGTYWLEWSTTGSGASGPFMPPVTVPGNLPLGNAQIWRNAPWAPVVDTTWNVVNYPGGQPIGLPFILEGTSTTGGGCYANCDNSTTAPILNVADFTCFLQRFAGGESYANCDNSTTPPVLNVADFTCFLQSFAAGCP